MHGLMAGALQGRRGQPDLRRADRGDPGGQRRRRPRRPVLLHHRRGAGGAV